MALARTPLRRLPPLAALGALALAAGCGPPPAVTVRGPVVRLRLGEYDIVPQELRVATGRLTLVVRDSGRLTHDLQVLTTDRAGQPDTPIAETHVLHPGETATLHVDLRPGTYALQCTVSNHADLGQTGSLTVTGRS